MEPSGTDDVSKLRSLEGFEQRCKSPAKDSKRAFVLLKEYVNTSGLSKQDLQQNGMGRGKTVCAYCEEPVDSNVRLIIEDLNTSCHPSCFKCGVCGKPMGDLRDNMFLRQRTIHCESCYAKVT